MSILFLVKFSIHMDDHAIRPPRIRTDGRNSVPLTLTYVSPSARRICCSSIEPSAMACAIESTMSALSLDFSAWASLPGGAAVNPWSRTFRVKCSDYTVPMRRRSTKSAMIFGSGPRPFGVCASNQAFCSYLRLFCNTPDVDQADAVSGQLATTFSAAVSGHARRQSVIF